MFCFNIEINSFLLPHCSLSCVFMSVCLYVYPSICLSISTRKFIYINTISSECREGHFYSITNGLVTKWWGGLLSMFSDAKQCLLGYITCLQSTAIWLVKQLRVKRLFSYFYGFYRLSVQIKPGKIKLTLALKIGKQT